MPEYMPMEALLEAKNEAGIVAAVVDSSVSDYYKCLKCVKLNNTIICML